MLADLAPRSGGRATAGLRRGCDLSRVKAEHCSILGPPTPCVVWSRGGMPAQAQFAPVSLFPSLFVKECYSFQAGLCFTHGTQAPCQAGLIYNQTNPSLLHMLGFVLVVQRQNK